MEVHPLQKRGLLPNRTCMVTLVTLQRNNTLNLSTLFSNIICVFWDNKLVIALKIPQIFVPQFKIPTVGKDKGGSTLFYRQILSYPNYMSYFIPRNASEKNIQKSHKWESHSLSFASLQCASLTTFLPSHTPLMRILNECQETVEETCTRKSVQALPNMRDLLV